MKLFHFWRSSASWRVRWALLHKGIPFESIPVNLLAEEQRQDAHRARNPIGHVPALEVAPGRFLAESVAILEWLEETHPEPALYPKDAWGRARVRQLCELVNSGIQPLQNPVVTERVSSDPAVVKAWVAHYAGRGLTAYETLLESFEAEGRGRFSWGDELTVADMFLVPQCFASRRFGLDVAQWPRVAAVEAAALATPHADAARPERQPGAP